MENVINMKEYNTKNDIMDFINGLETENTKVKYLGNIEKFINWKWNVPMEFVTVENINSLSYTDMKRFRDSMRRKYAAGSVNNIMISVYSLLKELKRVQYDNGKYVYDIEDLDRLRVKMLKNKNVTHSGYLTWEDTDAWIDFLEQSDESNKDRKIAFIKLARQTGLRKEALVGLKFSDIRKEDNNYVIHSFIKQKKHKVSIPDELAEMVFSLKRLGDTKDSKILNMSGKTCDRVIDMFKEEFNIDPESHITVHSLRNLFAWEIYCQSKDLLEVQNALGHEKLETTYLYIKNRKSVETSSSLHIGKEMDKSLLDDLNKEQIGDVFEQLPRSVQYEIINKVKELGYSQE